MTDRPSRAQRTDHDVLRAVVAVQQRISAARGDVTTVLDLVAEQAQRVTGADGAVIEMLEDQEMVYSAAAGTAAPFLGLRLNAGSSLSGTAVRTGEALVCRDSEVDSRVDRAAARKVGARSMILVPLVHMGNASGVLKVMAAEPDWFSERDVDTLRLLAGLMSASILTASETQARMQLHSRLTAIFDAAPEAIYAIESDDRISMWSSGAERLYGWSEEEVTGGKLPMLSPDAAAALPEHMRTVREAAVQHGWEAVHKSRDGTAIDVLVSSALKLAADGSPSGAVFIARDIRQQKHLEQRLRQSQKLEAIGRLAGGVAHDFNNMLTAIHGFSRLLLDDPGLTAEQQDNVQEVIRAAQRSTYITQQLLAYSRRQVLTPRALDLNSILQGMRGIIAQLLGRSISVKMDLGPALWRVSADRGQLEQVLLNLFANARDAIGVNSGGVTVRTANVRLSPDDVESLQVPAGEYIHLSLEDSGTGIKPAVLKHIFEPFYTTKHRTEGTGLGLATVQGVVYQTGGAIVVDSEEGRGSTFHVYLPRSHAEIDKSAPAAVAPPDVEQATILVVDDEEGVRNLMRKILERVGHRVIAAESPRAALAMIAAADLGINAIVSDVIMPGMTGFELAEATWGSNPGLPFLFVSGYVDTQLEHQAPGVRSSFLAKPFAPADLVAAVNDLITEET